LSLLRFFDYQLLAERIGKLMDGIGDYSVNQTRSGPRSPASIVRATGERLEGEIAFRSQSERRSNGGGDFPPIIAPSLVFADSVRWRLNSIRDQ
jgi:hypothetical protein